MSTKNMIVRIHDSGCRVHDSKIRVERLPFKIWERRGDDLIISDVLENLDDVGYHICDEGETHVFHVREEVK